MARSLDPGILSDLDDRRWPTDEGWPYPDDDGLEGDLGDEADPSAEPDGELLSLHGLGAHLLDGLTDLERSVLAARFGLDGGEPRSMKQLHADLAVDRAALRLALGDGLAKVRAHLV